MMENRKSWGKAENDGDSYEHSAQKLKLPGNSAVVHLTVV